MAKVAIVAPDRAVRVPLPAWIGGVGETQAYLDRARDPIHVHSHRLGAGEQLRFGPHATASCLYVYAGDVAAGGHALVRGSSVLVERGAVLAFVAGAAGAVLYSFAAGSSAHGVPVPGAQAHLLPGPTVPRYREGPAGGGVAGGMHADATDPRCPIWLHENRLPAPSPSAPAVDRDAGVHSHGEDEVILVTDGQMRLGARLYGPGTLLAVAAETMYGFTVGPDGLAFINFRPGAPDLIRFKSGLEIDEVGYWRARVDQPRYVSVPGEQVRVQA